jgi:acetyl esterase/lipase
MTGSYAGTQGRRSGIDQTSEATTMRSHESLRSSTAAAVMALLLTPLAPAGAQPGGEPVGDLSSVERIDGIEFAVVDGHSLKLDLYLPEGVEQPPLLVWVHGGGWSRGARSPVSTVAFVNDGYALASVDYRLSGTAPFPAQIHDIKAAVRFLRAEAGRYGYDATRIGMLGVSAGAHLAALAGVTNGDTELEGRVGEHLDQSSDVTAIVSYFGASNLTSILDQSTPFGLNIRVPGLETLLGGPADETAALAKTASPVFHVDASDPPLLLLHGDQDPQMPINQSHELHGAYQEHDLDVHFEVVHGARHGGAQFFDPERTALVEAFLDRHLRPGS